MAGAGTGSTSFESVAKDLRSKEFIGDVAPKDCKRVLGLISSRFGCRVEMVSFRVWTDAGWGVLIHGWPRTGHPLDCDGQQKSGVAVSNVRTRTPALREKVRAADRWKHGFAEL